MWQAVIMGISFGFVSSFHCIGMCGPLVLALPVQTLPLNLRPPAIIFYHTGRVITYTLLGVIFGLAGRHLFIAGFQQSISIITGTLILSIIIWRQITGKNISAGSNFFFKGLHKYVCRLWAKISVINCLLLGAVNGLLPCGMVYFALATSLTFGALSKSIFFMLSFGFGTLFLMFSLHYFGSRYVNMAMRNKMSKAVPVLLAFTGTLLILRGLNLGIPFISPDMGRAPSSAVICH